METRTNLPILGRTINFIKGLEKESDEVLFYCNDGSIYKMYHDQDCCECVSIDDVSGNVDDLIGSKILQADVYTKDMEVDIREDADMSGTYTFYNFTTINGYVQVKWFGTSNGYYSEKVDFEKLTPRIYNTETLDSLLSMEQDTRDILNKIIYKINPKYATTDEIENSLHNVIKAFENVINSDVEPLISYYPLCPKCGNRFDNVYVKDMHLMSFEEICMLAHKDPSIDVKKSRDIRSYQPMKLSCIYLSLDSKGECYIDKSSSNTGIRYHIKNGIILNKDSVPKDDYDTLIEDQQIGLYCPNCKGIISNDNIKIK